MSGLTELALPPPADLVGTILNQVNPVQNTWYDILNIAGQGFLHAANAEKDTNSNELEFRVTIDGGAANIMPEDNTDVTTRGVTGVRPGSGSGKRLSMPNLRFNSNLRVEIRTTVAAIVTLAGYVEHSIDQ